LHEECGRLAAAANLDRLVVVGDVAARALADAASASGMPAERVTWTASSATAADLILPWLEPGDVVLVKGSRGIRTDIVVQRISEEFS
jgi:UDP-N-acetylmuramoyl-tripeptide--D-alanyl-D-alanine ligase